MFETRKTHRLIGVSVIGALVASFGVVGPAAAQEVEPTDASSLVASLVDEAALEQAVEGFTAGDEASVAELAAVVAPEQGVDVEAASHVSLDGGELVLASDEVIGDGGDGLEIGINYAGASQAQEIVDGVAVSTQVEAGLDIVARATDDGAQVLAVLADENAPTELAFDLNLPEGATLEHLVDGSIAVFAPVEVEVPLPGEEERIDAAVLEILGEDIFSSDDLDALDAITDEQFEQLAEVPDVQTKTVTSTQQVAQIEAPWAVDAEGNAVETSYNLVDGTLTQTVVTDENTVFPVVADPSFAWWVGQGIMCGGAIASLAIAGYAKFSVAIAKLVVKMRKASATSNLGKAYKAWQRLGTSNSGRFNELVKQVKALAGAIAKHGGSAFAKHKAKGGKAAQSIAFIANGLITAATVLGLKSCYDMVKAAR